ncbi:MAG: YabP/YqfC family sporulation protein [Clostridia bacterium]|nr:YabP/YqfC family sporulation protein [Clostridia bacterium]
MFLEEKLRELGIDNTLPNHFCITNFSNIALFLKGKIKLISFSSTLITLNLGKTPLSVSGENFMIRDLTTSSLIITGKIAEIK